LPLPVAGTCAKAGVSVGGDAGSEFPQPVTRKSVAASPGASVRLNMGASYECLPDSLVINCGVA
jgi:hypothetical protein